MRKPHALMVLFFAVLAAPYTAAAQADLRVATWNIESVGAPESDEYDAAIEVLARIQADVIALNEVASAADTLHLESLAADAGYPAVAYTSGAPFGSDRNAILSRFPFTEAATEHDAATLSGDASANDVTRVILEAVIDLPGNAMDLTVISFHWKSGTGNDDEFRRTIESIRIRQALADLDPAEDAYLVMGDINEEIDSTPRTPHPFTSLPSGLPGSFSLGSDLAGTLALGGLPNDPFSALTDASTLAVTPIAALALDGSDGTRFASGRRLDYIFESPLLSAGASSGEAYDSDHEGMGGGLTKSGPALASATSANASDHLLVFADITVPAAAVAIPGLLPMPLLALATLVAMAGAARLYKSGRA